MMEHNKRTFKKECFGLQRSERVMTEQIQKEYDNAKRHYENAKYLQELAGSGITVITCYVGESSGSEDSLKDLKMNLENKKLSLKYSKNKTKFYIYAHNFDVANAKITHDKLFDIELKIMENMEEQSRQGVTIHANMMDITDGVMEETRKEKGDQSYLMTCDHFQNANKSRNRALEMCGRIKSYFA